MTQDRPTSRDDVRAALVQLMHASHMWSRCLWDDAEDPQGLRIAEAHRIEQAAIVALSRMIEEYADTRAEIALAHRQELDSLAQLRGEGLV